MKQRKTGVIILGITAAFLIFCFGYYFGGKAQGDEVRLITAQAETQITTEETSVIQPRGMASEAPSETSLGTRLNINTATAEQLETLPGIGTVIAGRIVEYRETNGPFQTVEELKNVSGIGEKRFQDICDLVTVEEYDENTGS